MIQPSGKHIICAYLDVNHRHSELFGDCILLRDDDGMGFALGLDSLIGKHVQITIEELPTHDKRLWLTDTERNQRQDKITRRRNRNRAV